MWDALVDPGATGGGPPSTRPRAERTRKQGTPEVVSRGPMLEFEGDDLERLRHPELLRRD